MSNAEEVLAAAMNGRQIDGTRMYEPYPEPELLLEAHEEAARLVDAARQSALHLRNALGVVVVMMSLFAISFLWRAYWRRRGGALPAVPIEFDKQRALVKAQRQLQRHNERGGHKKMF